MRLMQVRGRKPIPKQRSIRYELTGVCNYLCNYCSYNNTFNLGKHSVIWKEVVNWCNKYNSISKLSNELILWGGEPTLHPDFWQVIDSVQIPFGLYTNFSQDINFWNQLLCYNHLCQIIATYHSTKISADEFIKKVYYFNKKIPGFMIFIMLEKENLDLCIDVFNEIKSFINDNVKLALKAVDTTEPYYPDDLYLPAYNVYLHDDQLIDFIFDTKRETNSRFDIIHKKNNDIYKQCTNFTCDCPRYTIHIDALGNVFNCLVYDDNNKPICTVKDSINVEKLDSKYKLCKNKYCYTYLQRNGIKTRLYSILR